MLLREAPSDDHAAFYSAQIPDHYGRSCLSEGLRRLLHEWLAGVDPQGLLLEIGSGQGALDGIHPGYVASDFSLFALRTYSTGPRVQADAAALPFKSDSLSGIVTYATLEHVPDPAAALAEIDRCLAPGGRAFIFPAWFVRPWASSALHVRGYRDLGLRERLRKATIPLRDSRPFWFAKVLPSRLRREFALARGRRDLEFSYRRLEPNLEVFLASDSDAFSSMDPHAAAAYFLSRCYEDLRRPAAWRRLVYGSEPVLVAKPREGDGR